MKTTRTPEQVIVVIDEHLHELEHNPRKALERLPLAAQADEIERWKEVRLLALADLIVDRCGLRVLARSR